MLGGELIYGCPVDEPVQRCNHRGAVASRVVGGAVQRVSQEFLRSLCLRDHLVQLGDLPTYGLAPLRTGGIEDGGRGVQRQPQLVSDLQEREAP